MINSVFFSILLSAFTSYEAFAEYRAYQYYVRSKIQNINPSKAELVTSTLDPRTYATYHGGSLSVDITLMRSWMCMGNTSHEDICTISKGIELKEFAKVGEIK